MFIDKTSQRQIQVITWPNELNIAQVEKKLTTDVKKHHSSSDKIQDPHFTEKKKQTTWSHKGTIWTKSKQLDNIAINWFCQMTHLSDNIKLSNSWYPTV